MRESYRRAWDAAGSPTQPAPPLAEWSEEDAATDRARRALAESEGFPDPSGF
ncbi:MAG: hypothetical protein H8M99_01835 [Gloeobacteraceae cyanobacterium ES-bin-144]|nr:hypothetical protein [Verrucomicrobiales bacterium]